MDPETSGAKSTSIAPNRKRLIIRSTRDIDTAQREQNGKVILSLEPDSDVIRSSEFLEEIAALAIEKNFPVLMTGSILAHAFYTLERKGVSVVTGITHRSRVRQRQVFGKLVRDEIPAKIAEHGERANLARIAKFESRTALVVKLFEEAQELLRAGSPNDVTTELADLLEVIRALTAATGASWDEVQSVAEEKRHLRGSFARNVVLMETSWPGWQDTDKQPVERIIPLKDLARISGGKDRFLLNFVSAIAQGAPNVVDLGDGVRISVSVVDGGIRIQRLSGQEQTDPQQLEFGFAALKTNEELK